MSTATESPKRSEDRLSLLEVLGDGSLVMELRQRARVYTTTIAADADVSMIEAAVLAGVTRSTVYNWAKTAGRGRYSYHAVSVPLVVVDGRVELADLRRYIQALGSWWMTDHPPSKRVADAGPVREVSR